MAKTTPAPPKVGARKQNIPPNVIANAIAKTYNKIWL